VTRVQFGSGGSAIVVEDGFAADLHAMLERASRGVLSAMEAEADEVYLRVLGAWPEKTGRSRAEFFKGVRVEDRGAGEVIEVFIGNEREALDERGRPYLYFIRPRGGGPTLWSSLVQRPMAEAGDRLADELGPIVARSMMEAP
jgi:hypothetical protein